MSWQHIYPINEEYLHLLTGLECKCNPQIDWENNIVIHSSSNYREVIEEAKEINNENL